MVNPFLRCLPPLFLLLLICWSYYSYVVEYCVLYLTGVAKKSIYIAIYHFMLIMFTWSFLNTMCHHHDPIPEEYRLTPNENARLLTFNDYEADQILKRVVNLRKLEIFTCTVNRRVRYCKECMHIKPDRTHHCSTCDKCILKMDHHCPWIANCVGYCNYKQFVLMLLYGSLWCAFYVGTVAEHIMEIWRDFQNSVNKVILGIGFVVAALAGLLMSFLFFYHVGLVCRNESTLEALRETTFRQDNLTFDLGKWNNFVEVFGDNICCWFIPTQTAQGNGHEFSVTNLIV